MGAFINFDMESYALKDLTLSLFRSILVGGGVPRGAAPSGSRSRPTCATARGTCGSSSPGRGRSERPIVVRLVKGAYWDYETIARRPARLAGARLVAEAGERRQLREAFRAPPARTPTSPHPPSPRTTSAPARMRSPRPSASASIRAPTSSRRSTGWPTS